MNEILLISETEILPELELAKQEVLHYGYTFTSPIPGNRTLTYLQSTTINTVLINAYKHKLEALRICQSIKDQFRGAIKVFVFIPNSTPNEGSKFGLANAEVEDKKSIINLIEKLPNESNRNYILQENIISTYSLNGGSGSSTLSLLLAHLLDRSKEKTLVLESSNNFSIKKYLSLNNRISLLSRDRSKELGQAKDIDWLNGFISKSSLIPNMSYLNLFSNSMERSNYLANISPILNKIAEEINALATKSQTNSITNEELDAQFFTISNSLKLISKECEGDSYSLFEEIIQIGSKISKNLLFDLSSDLHSPLNKQLLKLSNKLLILFKDSYSSKDELASIKSHLENTYNLEVIPIMSSSFYHYHKYKSLHHSDWKSLLGLVPLIYPYDPEAITRFLLDGEHINPKSKLYEFVEDLQQICFKQKRNSYDFNKKKEKIRKEKKTLLSFLKK